jgi:hypothetical protein
MRKNTLNSHNQFANTVLRWRPSSHPPLIFSRKTNSCPTLFRLLSTALPQEIVAMQNGAMEEKK